jgi:hypothetical protein
MQALLPITTLDIDRERRVMAVRTLGRLHCAKRCVFVDQQIVIAETFAGKHFCQSRLSCINLSSLCQVRNVGINTQVRQTSTSFLLGNLRTSKELIRKEIICFCKSWKVKQSVLSRHHNTMLFCTIFAVKFLLCKEFS